MFKVILNNGNIIDMINIGVFIIDLFYFDLIVLKIMIVFVVIYVYVD